MVIISKKIQLNVAENTSVREDYGGILNKPMIYFTYRGFNITPHGKSRVVR